MRVLSRFSLLLALALAACAPPPAAPPTPSSTAPAAVSPTAPPAEEAAATVSIPEPPAGEVRLWHVFSGEAKSALEEIAAAFNAGNTYGIIILTESRANTFQLGQDMNAALTEGNWPGLVAAYPYQLAAWQAAGLVAPIQHFVWDPQFGLTEEERALVVNRLWDPLNNPADNLGVPALRGVHALFYNAAWARELGFAAPPATLEDFRRQACAAAAANGDGTGGWLLTPDGSALFAWLRAFGAPGETDSGYAFDTFETQAAAAFLRTLLEDSCAWRPASRYPDAEFAARQGLFYSASTTGIPALAEAMQVAGNADDWTLIPYPCAGEGCAPVVTVHGPALAILDAPLEAQSAAWAFIRYFLQPDVQAEWIRRTGALPLGQAADPSPGAAPQWLAAADLAWQVGVPEPARPSWGVVLGALADAARALFDPALSQAALRGVLPQLQATADEIDAAGGR
ncbi:MAG: extracellular solute-binding protein [Chloroflexi bacterium]|nr:extracellular solute-binding protein [Chloroflexota bacterium]